MPNATEEVGAWGHAWKRLVDSDDTPIRELLMSASQQVTLGNVDLAVAYFRKVVRESEEKS